MSTPVTMQPRRASGMAVLPVPQAMSSTRAPAGMLRAAMKSSAPAETVLATTPKSPAIQVERMLDLICSMVGAGVLMARPRLGEIFGRPGEDKETLAAEESGLHPIGKFSAG